MARQEGLLPKEDWWISHHGDLWRENVVHSMDPQQRLALEALQDKQHMDLANRQPIVVRAS